MKALTTILPVYNGDKLIKNALQSLAWQTRRPDRVIVLDDASTDATAEAVRAFTDLPCEYLRNEKNLGYYGNFNQALAYAPATDYLHILHQDDILKPQFYEQLTRALATADAPAISYCKSKNYDVGNVPADAPQLLADPGTARVISQSEFLGDRAELRAFPFCGVLIKTGRAELRSKFRNDIPLAGDMVFWADLALESRHIAEVEAVLLLNGIHRHTKSPDLKIWILDDWKVMQLIEQKRQSGGLGGWLRRHKLACKFAARCASKRKQILNQYPETAKQVEIDARRAVGPLHWQLGLWAAKLRGKA